MSEGQKDKLILDASDNSFHAFGYSYIFKRRIKWYLRYIKTLKFIGLVIPVTVGALAIGYEFKPEITKVAILIAVPVTVIQLIVTLLSIIFGWDEELVYAFEAEQDYNNLYEDFKKLYKYPSPDPLLLKSEFDISDTKFKSRSQQDAKHSITDKERRIGMRYSLREHKKECAGCSKIPTDMKASECGVCGNF